MESVYEARTDYGTRDPRVIPEIRKALYLFLPSFKNEMVSHKYPPGVRANHEDSFQGRKHLDGHF